MKKIYQFICAICVICGFTACQDRDLPGSGAMQVASPDVTTINEAAQSILKMLLPDSGKE